jgi:non-ribosomal peptide synthetase component E (peptide arylation enzyme)
MNSQTSYTAESHIQDLQLKAKPISEKALAFTIDWIGSYECDPSDLDTLQLIADAISYLEKDLDKRIKTRIEGKMKRDFARANGLKVSQVRIVPAEKVAN